MGTIAISDEIRVFTISRNQASLIVSELQKQETSEKYVVEHLNSFIETHSELRPLIVTPETYTVLHDLFTLNMSSKDKYLATIRDECHNILRF